MVLSRRQFMKRSGALGAGLSIAPLLGSPLVNRALADIGNRFLVVVFLEGGNDGLNTITPMNDGAGSLRADYEDARRTVNISADELLLLGTDPSSEATLGMNPGLSGLQSLYQSGQLAVLQNCGYPDPDLSHKISRRIWETAAPLGSGRTEGWLGRSLESEGYGSKELPVFTTVDRIPGEFAQGTTGVLTVRDLAKFGFPGDPDWPSDDSVRKAASAALFQNARDSGEDALEYLGATGGSLIAATENYPALHDAYASTRGDFLHAYRALDGEVGAQLSEVAKVIYGTRAGATGVNSRFFQITQDGYDTHANQGRATAGGRHYNLMRDLGDGLGLFFQDIEDMGAADEVLVLVWSEFGRRVQQNSNGTDHGSAAPMFLMGKSVQGGIFDPHPNIAAAARDWGGNTSYSQDNTNAFRSRDFRDVYGTVLKHWVEINEGTILSDILPPDGSHLDPDQYWVSGRHNFDLPALP
jgi:uncharacterized protein (DUF1501 family)